MIEVFLSYLVLEEASLEDTLVNEVKEHRPELLIISQSFRDFDNLVNNDLLLKLEEHMPLSDDLEEKRILDQLTKNIEDINSMIPGQNMVKSQISQHTLLSKATLQQITEKFDSLKNEIGKQIGYDQATKENHEVLLAMITIRMIPYINSIVKNNFDQCSFAPYKRHDCGWDGISKSECEVF